MQKIENIKGCIFGEEFNLFQHATNKEDFHVKGLLLPKDKVSRNGVLYDWESAKAKAQKFVGKTVNYNHIIDDDKPPVGGVEDITVKEDDDDEGIAGLYYDLKIDENSEYADSIKKGFLNKVSLQVTADAQKEETNDDGETYTRAWIKDPLEVSIVKVPGFDETTMEVAIAEAFKSSKKEWIIASKDKLSDLPPEVIKRGYSNIKDAQDEAKALEKKNRGKLYYVQREGMNHKAGVDNEDTNTEEAGISTANIPSKTKMGGPKKKETSDNTGDEEKEAEAKDNLDADVDTLTEEEVDKLNEEEADDLSELLCKEATYEVRGGRSKGGDAYEGSKLIVAKSEEEAKSIAIKKHGFMPYSPAGRLRVKKKRESFEEVVTPLPEDKADPEELKKGVKVEMEHTNDKEEAKKIALQHLAEVPDYYTKLNKHVEFKVVDALVVLSDDEAKELIESFKEKKSYKWSDINKKLMNVGWSTRRISDLLLKLPNKKVFSWEELNKAGMSINLSAARLADLSILLNKKESFNENQMGPYTFETAKRISLDMDSNDYRLIYSDKVKKWFFINKDDVDFHFWGIKLDIFKNFESDDSAINYLTDGKRIEKLQKGELKELLDLCK